MDIQGESGKWHALLISSTKISFFKKVWIKILGVVFENVVYF